MRTIAEVEGFASLGLYEDAWETLEALPPALRLDIGVLALRLLILVALKKWELGAEIARLISPTHPPVVRESAGQFHLGHAVALCRSGDVGGAKAAVKALSAVWPEGRILALDSDDLALLW